MSKKGFKRFYFKDGEYYDLPIPDTPPTQTDDFAHDMHRLSLWQLHQKELEQKHSEIIQAELDVFVKDKEKKKQTSIKNLPVNKSNLPAAQLEANKLWALDPDLLKKTVCDRLVQKGMGSYSTLYNKIIKEK